MDSEGLFQRRVRERDLDNFLVEELHSSGSFREWVLSRLTYAFSAPASTPTRLGKSAQRLQDDRQTDVQIGWFDAADQLVACVLIECKVTAGFQPGQAESYAAELARCREILGPTRAAAILVAPAARLLSLNGREAFDGCISLEEIIGFLQARLSGSDLPTELALRLGARILLLEALCGKRSGSGWSPITLPQKREFSDQYTELAAQVVPKLRVKPSTDGPKAITKFFEGANLPPGFPSVRIKHEFGSKVAVKYANLQFDGMADAVARISESGLLANSGFSIVASGKSLFVRKATPAIDPSTPFPTQEEKARKGLEAIRDLATWLEANAASLAQLLRGDSITTEASGSRLWV